jgi:hypothetical protein
MASPARTTPPEIALPVDPPDAVPSASSSPSPSEEMPPDDDPPEPLSPSPEEVAAAAADLNAASNDLGATIIAIEAFLESRNIGVPAWVRVKGWENEGGEYWKRELGYDWVGGSWHLAIRESHGHENYPDQVDGFTLAFNSSPRKARISAVDKLPELLKELIKEAGRTARRLREKAVEANAFAATLNISTTPKKVRK